VGRAKRTSKWWNFKRREGCSGHGTKQKPRFLLSDPINSKEAIYRSALKNSYWFLIPSASLFEALQWPNDGKYDHPEQNKHRELVEPAVKDVSMAIVIALKVKNELTAVGMKPDEQRDQ
jgi:hypothetical protein